MGRQLYKAGQKGINLYKVQMGFVSPMALGLVLAIPQRKVVVLEGDGSTLKGLGAWATTANEAPKNLVLIVFDNGTYEGGGAQPNGFCRKGPLGSHGQRCWFREATYMRGPGIFSDEHQTSVD